jgi:hypothetical protein
VGRLSRQIAAAGVSWSRCGGADCVRLTGLAPQADVQVHPGLTGLAGEFPPMAGRLVHDGGDMCFVPRFAFVGGMTYAVSVAGVTAAVLTRPQPDHPATTQVLGISPTAAQVPRNLLRLYVSFSAPMSEGYAAGHVRVVDDAGQAMAGVLLPAEHELWDGARRRLTVLLDPARIKRGLAAHRQAGYPLRSGEPFRLIVAEGFRDARGAPLRFPAERRYEVGDDERRRVEPGAWNLTIPSSHTTEALEVTFDRPLDHGLLARGLHVAGPDGRLLSGTPQPGPEDRSWRLAPRQPWARGTHQLLVEPILEDLAGNSVSRIFDRDLTRPADQPRQALPVTVTFRPR